MTADRARGSFDGYVAGTVRVERGNKRLRSIQSLENGRSTNCSIRCGDLTWIVDEALVDAADQRARRSFLHPVRRRGPACRGSTPRASDGKLQIVPARYDLDDGTVTMLDQ